MSAFSKALVAALLLLVVAGRRVPSLQAQQPNTPAASAVWGGEDGPPWPIMAFVGVPAVTALTLDVAGDPNQGYLVAFTPAPLLAGGFPTPFGILDLDITSGYGFLMDGITMTTGTLLDSLAITDGSGTSNLVFPITSATAGITVAGLQALVTDASAPFGSTFSAASRLVITVSGPCPPTVGGDLVPLTDDGSINVVLGSSFVFYGTTWSDVFVNMNGNLTFGSGDASWTPAGPAMDSGAPRIAPCWDDFSPSDLLQGTVRADDGATAFRVEWFDVRRFGQVACGGGLDTNNFCAELHYGTGVVRMNYGLMLLCTMGTDPGLDQVVGLSPGGGASMAGPLDLSLGGGGTAPGDGVYEVFSGSNPFDLGPSWSGPVSLDFTPNGGVGVGPYSVQ